MNSCLTFPSKAMVLTSSQIEAIINYLGAASIVCGGIGSLSALGVDFVRRRVRAKASEYAASNDFKLLRSDLIESHDEFQLFLKEYRDDRRQAQANHLDLCQRVARLEVKKDA